MKTARRFVTDSFETFTFAIVATSHRPGWLVEPFSSSWPWWIYCGLAAAGAVLDAVLLALLLFTSPAQVQAVLRKHDLEVE